MSERSQASSDFYRIDDLLTDADREVRDRVRAYTTLFRSARSSTTTGSGPSSPSSWSPSWPP